MAKYNFTRTSDINISLEMTHGDLQTLNRFLTEHGGEETKYSSIRSLHQEIRDIVAESYNRMATDCQYEEQFGQWNPPVEYKVKVKAAEPADLADA